MRTYNLGQVDSLMTAIRQRLVTPPPAGSTDPAESLATEYAALTAEINRRLKQCLQIIESGNSEQAIMLAEEEPALLDSIALLNFSKFAQWEHLCGQEGFPAPQRPDPAATRRLNALYSSGDKSEQLHALNRQLRVAMLTQKPERALSLVRKILALDPGDTTAIEQRGYLEQRVASGLFSELRSALRTGNSDVLLPVLRRCEAAGLDDSAELEEARGIRARVEAQEAREAVTYTLSTLSSLQAEDRWEEAGRAVGEVERLVENHSLEMQESEVQALASAKTFFRERAGQEQTRQARQAALDVLASGVDQATARLHERSVPLDELEALEAGLRRALSQATGFDEPAPDELTRRARAVLDELSHRGAARKKLRVLARVALLLSTGVLLGAVSWLGYDLFQSVNRASELKRLISERLAVPLERQIEATKVKPPLVPLPMLQSGLVEAEDWLKGAAENKAKVETLLQKARSMVEKSFADAEPRKVSELFAEIEGVLESLPLDTAGEIRQGFADILGRKKIWMADRQAEITRVADSQLQVMRGLNERLSASGDPADIGNAAQQLEPLLVPLLPWLDSAAEDMKLPDATATELRQFGARLNEARALLSARDQALNDLNTAQTLEQFKAALSKLGQVGLPASSDVKAAQLMGARQFDESSVLGEMLMPDFPEFWAAIKSEDDLSRDLFPAEPTLDQVDLLREITTNRNIDNISEVDLRKVDPYATPDEARLRTLFVRGQTDSQWLSGNVSAVNAWSADVYDPRLSPNEVEFRPRSFTWDGVRNRGDKVESQRWSSGTEAFRKMRIGEMVETSYDRYRNSVFDVTDRVLSLPTSPALLSAFTLQKLWGVAQTDPVGWGLPLAPAFTRDMKAIDTILADRTLDGSEWMLPASSVSSSELGSFFAARPPVSYSRQATLNRHLLAEAYEAGASYCGFAGEDGPNLRPDLPSGVETLWGYREGGKVLEPLYARDEGGWTSLQKASLLTPLFSVFLESAEAIARARAVAGIDEQELSLYVSDVPPLFLPSGNP